MQTAPILRYAAHDVRVRFPGDDIARGVAGGLPCERGPIWKVIRRAYRESAGATGNERDILRYAAGRLWFWTAIACRERSWGSVEGGKWHVTLDAEPSFMRDEQSLCGLTFRPLNVTWHEQPPTNPHYICKHCLRAAD